MEDAAILVASGALSTHLLLAVGIDLPDEQSRVIARAVVQAYLGVVITDAVLESRGRMDD